jgi:class 3 adenylate cyclase
MKTVQIKARLIKNVETNQKQKVEQAIILIVPVRKCNIILNFREEIDENSQEKDEEYKVDKENQNGDYNKLPNQIKVEEEKVIEKNNPEAPKVIEKPKSKIKIKLKGILDHWTTQAFMTSLTVYILFADDMKLIFTSIEADWYFSLICVIIMGIFTLEFIISSFCVDDYFLGFYFWLDFVSVLSMLLDVSWFYTFLLNIIAGTSGTGNVKGIAALAKAGKGAKLGSRAIRILRILRIIRLVRISKLYKASEKLIEDRINKEMEFQNKQRLSHKRYGIMPSTKNDNNEHKEENGGKQEESKVGKKLSDLTTRRVIILVLSMMIGIILFDSSFYLSPLTSMDFGIKAFAIKNLSDPKFNLTFNIYVNEHKNISTPIIYAKVAHLEYGNTDSINNLRDSEKIYSSDDCENLLPNDPDNSICLSVFDSRSASQLSSILNIIKTIFICLVLSGGAVCFNKDTTSMVLEPIESMIRKIKEISKNPIEAMQNNEKEEYAKSLIELQQNTNFSLVKCLSCKKNGTKKKDAPLETVVLENTITKIGALLALGFGEAGSEIIAKNMQNNKGGDVNPLLPGKKVVAIYGFCDIRNFTDTTEVLQEKVMIFVNEIAEIVHEITAEHCGSANKNIGDAFLLVWKFEDHFVYYDENHELKLQKSPSVSQICDMALISFLKILAKVHKSFILDKYRKNEGLNKRIKNYCVKMGFGLHLGWSIEGAIGSNFKIDASYLSPNVNTASKLEEGTKEYGVQLVISGEFINHVSEEARKRCRVIDKLVGDNGEEEYLYTVDFDLNALKIEEYNVDEEKNQANAVVKDEKNLAALLSNKKLEKYKKRMTRKLNYEDAINCQRPIWKDYEDTDEDYAIMRKKYTPEFYENYKIGFNSFQDGDWQKAKLYFENAQEILGDKDGPTENLMRIMKESNFVKPHDWKGNRSEHGH